MPANKKYLTSSKGLRISKFLAGFLGGYLVAMSFHLALAAWINTVNVMITSTFTGFILWAVLFVMAYLAKKVWQIWVIYIFLTVSFLGMMYLGNNIY